MVIRRRRPRAQALATSGLRRPARRPGAEAGVSHGRARGAVRGAWRSGACARLLAAGAASRVDVWLGPPVRRSTSRPAFGADASSCSSISTAAARPRDAGVELYRTGPATARRLRCGGDTAAPASSCRCSAPPSSSAQTNASRSDRSPTRLVGGLVQLAERGLARCTPRRASMSPTADAAPRRRRRRRGARRASLRARARARAARRGASSRASASSEPSACASSAHSVGASRAMSSSGTSAIASSGCAATSAIAQRPASSSARSTSACTGASATARAPAAVLDRRALGHAPVNSSNAGRERPPAATGALTSLLAMSASLLVAAIAAALVLVALATVLWRALRPGSGVPGAVLSESRSLDLAGRRHGRGALGADGARDAARRGARGRSGRPSTSSASRARTGAF